MDEDTQRFLPADGLEGTLIGRVWVPATATGSVAGPSPVIVTESGVYDLSPIAPTCADLLNEDFATEEIVLGALERLGSYEEIMAHTLRGERRKGEARFLSPIDLQAIKACGVTFVTSLLERVIDERVGGDARAAGAIRGEIQEQIGGDIAAVRPGSEEAEELKETLVAEGLWSQYLEVGLGPFAEVFTKGQPLSSVGTGAKIGIHPESEWNNSEPEVVMIVDRHREVRGATLGNDVNLRDIEGRSALLLGQAKDYIGACAVGPFVRLFDDTFSLEDVRRAEVSLVIEGQDGFRLEDASFMERISRDVLSLVEQAMNVHHHYPDGMALFTGTLFVPTQDRDPDGRGFAHKPDDIVYIGSESLGTLVNRVARTDEVPSWDFGTGALMRNLSRRGLL